MSELRSGGMLLRAVTCHLVVSGVGKKQKPSAPLGAQVNAPGPQSKRTNQTLELHECVYTPALLVR